MTLPPEHPENQDAIRQAIQRMNAERTNGMVPIANVQPRKSGWVCPRCGQEADQVCEPAPGSILGYRWVTFEDGRPKPLHVGTSRVVGFEINDHGVEDTDRPKLDTTYHCLNCFNHWQREQMMKDIRANVPQLRYTGDESG